MYSKAGSTELHAFVRPVIGLAYVPLDRLQEGQENLNILAEKLKEKQLEFAQKLLRYLLRTWINGQYTSDTRRMADSNGKECRVWR
jgi:hypothetical protein